MEGRGDSSSPERTATTKPLSGAATNEDVFRQRNAGGQLNLMLNNTGPAAAASKAGPAANN